MTEEEIEAYENLVSLPGEWDNSETILINVRDIKNSKEKFNACKSYGWQDLATECEKNDRVIS